jgi:hypothetical protein
MGDNINIDWGAANQPAPNPVNAFMQAYQQGRAMGVQRTGDEALQDALHNPSDIAALTKLSVYNPDAAKSLFGVMDYQRHVAQRQAGADLFSAYAQPQTNAFTPPQQPAQGALPPVAPGASFDQAMAPIGAPGTPAPQMPGNAMTPQPASPQGGQQSSPMSDPMHPVAQQIGQAAVSGQPVDPARAWAALAQYSDPAEIEKYQTAIASMDKMRLTRLADANDSLGAEAQSLLKVPQEQRAAELQRIAPMLMQHGITQEQLQAAMQTGLTDTYLQGIIGQSLGTKGLIDQQNTEKKLGFEGQRIGIEQQNADSTRMTAIAGSQGTGINDGYGNIINNRTGQIMHSPDGGTGGGAPLNPEIISYAKSKGLGDPQAQALAAVVAGEGGQINNTNQSGGGHGAYGLFQIRDSGGLQDMLRQYGPNPTLQNQVDFYLAHNAAAAKAFWSAKDPQTALQSLITDAQRAGPDSGALMGRAMASLNGGGSGGGSFAGGLTPDAVHDQALEAITKNGGVPVPGMARNKAAQVAITNEISRTAKAAGTTVPQMVAWAAANHADAASLGTLEKQATIVRAAEGAAQKNGDLALSLAPKVNNGNIQIFNAWKNHWSTSMGDPAVAKFAAALDTFSLEYAKVMGGGNPTVSGQEHARGLISSSQSPQQLQGVISTLKKDMENRRQAFWDERTSTISRMASGGNPNAGGGPLAHPADISAIMSKYGH